MDGKGNDRPQSGLKTAFVALVALAAIAGSAFYLFHTPSEKGEKLATDASEALGLRAAEEVARLLRASDVLVFVRGPISSRRGSAIAGISCGLPVICFGGPQTAEPISDAGVVLVSRSSA
jgi:hypothetical protein